MRKHELTVQVAPEGPLDSLERARDHVRANREAGQPARVLIAPGRYHLAGPLILGPEDSGTTFAALEPANPPVFDGAVTLNGWSRETAGGREVWAAPAPSVPARSLFVDGVRHPRPRFPHAGSLRIAGQPGLTLDSDMIDVLYQGSDRFHFGEGDAWTFYDLERVEAVVQHYWVEERMPLVDLDLRRRLARSSHTSIFALRDDLAERFARYYWDNVYEVLGEEPGQWYLDWPRRRVLYAPRPQDRLETFRAELPVTNQFVVVRGGAEDGGYVRDVRLERLVFRHADWQAPRSSPPFQIPQDDELSSAPYASAPQGAADAGAVIEFAGVRESAVVGCRVEHIGGYAVELGDGCQDVAVTGNQLVDLGGGGVHLHGAEVAGSPAANARNAVVDNEIGHAGQVFPQSVGVLARHSADNLLARNHIHHLYYSGISLGWVWGYGEHPSARNVVEANHIHHLGRGLLNDMGGVYVLGVQPGTVIRGNLIHDVECANYGGWGVYLDEGSSHVLVEGNICHDVSSQCFHQHYGRANTVRHNVFAFGRQGQVEITRPEDHVSFTLERNVLIGDGVPAITGRGGRADVRGYRIHTDHNLFWDVTGSPVPAGNSRRDADARWSLADVVPLEEWRQLGFDRNSVLADPQFADLAGRRFVPAAESPVHALGIEVPDLSPMDGSYNAEPSGTPPQKGRP